MARIDFTKVGAFKEFAEALSLELCFGYKSNIPVDFKTLDYYKNKFESAISKKICLSGDCAGVGDGEVYLAKKYFNSMDFDLSDFPAKAIRYYNMLKDAYVNFENGKWVAE